MDRFPANEHNIKSLGIDFDNLTHSEIIDAIYKIDGAVYDSETNFIYTDIMDCFDDEQYFNLLREVGVPTLSDFLKQLSSIKDEKIRSDLHYHGFFRILDAEYNAKFKILDKLLFKEKPNSSSSLVHEDESEPNPYPRIFTSIKAFDKFKKLREEFGDGDEDLANYSFVYHRMVKDKFIYDDYKQKEFVFFLLDFNINIKRIKSKSQLGKTDFRESIYNSLK